MDLSISNSFFNEKFKDYVRNFYVYGCIPDSDFPGSSRTYHDDFMRIEHIGQIPLSADSKSWNPRWRMEGNSKCLRLVTADSRNLHRNPIHIFYRLHEAKETEALFFLIVMLLAARSRDTADDLKIDQIMSWTDPKWRKEWETLCEENAQKHGAYSNKERERRKKEASKLKKAFRDKTQAGIRKRMIQEFGTTGILDYDSVGNNNIWSLGELTMQSLLNSVSNEEAEELVAAIDFFMRLGPFGEIGDMLLSRIEPESLKKILQRSIRLNQFYLCKSLNDYNSADILRAIHLGSWIIVTYYNPHRDEKGYVLCRPLKLRSSVTSGREYLGYYDPARRQARYLRMEFVQSVEILDQRYIPWLWAALRGTPCQVRRQDGDTYNTYFPVVFDSDGSGRVQLTKYSGSGNRLQGELCHQEADGTRKSLNARIISDCRLPDQETMEAEIAKAGELLDLAWGASVPYASAGQTLEELPVHELTMTLYVWAGDEHIRRRLRQEARQGICEDLDDHRIRFTTAVLDPWEMIPWISSFAGRIKEITCTDPAFENHLRGHLRQMHDLALEGRRSEAMEYPKNVYEIPNLLRDTKTQTYKGNLRSSSPLCRKEPADHELLFSPLYSQVYQNCFTAFDRLCADAGSNRRRFWNDIGKSADDVSVFDPEALDKLSTLPKKGTIARFEQMLPRIQSICDLASKVQDVTPVMQKLVPLTILERKWLLAILQDPLIGYFLRPETVDVLSTILKQVKTGRPLYLPGEIDFFDRYLNLSHTQAHTKAYFRDMRLAVKNGRSARVLYRAPKGGKSKIMEVLPLRMEYAARDDAFRIRVRDLKAGPGQLAIRTLRLERIEDVRLGREVPCHPGSHDSRPPEQEYVLRFGSAKNLPDRILTQFAPWEKQCTKFGDDNYQLRFRADESEWLDIMIRILSFGNQVQILQPEEVAQEIRFRLKRQKNMWM